MLDKKLHQHVTENDFFCEIGNEESEKTCIEFIDRYITCKRDEHGDMSKLIGYQIHKHSHTCEKGGKAVGGCRFGFPRPPLPTTMIPHPLPKNIDKKDKKVASDIYKRLLVKLVEMGRSYKDNIEHGEFLEELGMTMDDYLLALRFSIKRSTVFLRRQTSEIFVNNYNKDILLAWRANMDIQFILDAYACAKYCVGYMLKAEGGVSKLLRAACREARCGNTVIKDKLQQFAKILINGSEISAQDAAAFILGIPNTSCSRIDTYINTAQPNDRISMLKPREELEKLPDDSEDITVNGPLDHYVQRPDELEDVCLADFSALFQFSTRKRSKSTKSDESDCSGIFT